MRGELYITGLCPHCSLKLDYQPEEKAVVCTGCGATLPTSALLLLSKEQEASNKFSESGRMFSEGLVSSEAALIYFDNFVEKYDWESFTESSSLTIPMLDDLAETALFKFPSDHLSYVLDFKRLAFPFLKKIYALDKLIVDIAHNTKNGGSADVFEIFDVYSAITKNICENRDSVKARLVYDIDRAKKFGASKEEIEDLTRSVEFFDDIAGKVTPVTDINEIGEYSKIKLTKNVDHIADLRKRGIDPEKTYEKACALMESGDINNALRLFIIINPYKDSEDIIKRNTSIYRFGNGLYEMAGRAYLKKSEILYTKRGKIRDTGCYALYEVIDGEPSPEPTISGVTEVLAVFGSRIFFIRNGRYICCFDANSTELYANVKIVDEATDYGYGTDGKIKIVLSKDRSCFYIKKRLNNIVKKCLFKRKPSYNRNNNYSLLKVSMDVIDCRIEIPVIIDIMDQFDDTIFYTAIPEGMYHSVFRMYDLKNGIGKTLLGPECVLQDVKAGRIVYTEWAPNEYNMNLYTLEHETNERTLIAKNIRSFHSVIENRIFYTVGGENYSRLYSAGIDGEGKTEIVGDADEVLAIKAGWIYYRSGEGRNACLKKVSLDGQSKMLIADRFERIIKFSNGFVYYAGRGNSLCMARCDGGGAITIDTDIYAEDVVINENCIYYLKEDMLVDEKQIYSLYSSTLDGKNLDKLIYDVSAIKDHSKDVLYVCRSDNREFMISTPISKKESRTEYIVAVVDDYCRFDKNTEELSLIATVGIPEESYVPIKKRCLFFKKTRYLPTTVVPMSKSTARYERVGVASGGDVLREEQEYLERKKAAKKKRSKDNTVPAKNTEPNPPEDIDPNAPLNPPEDLDINNDNGGTIDNGNANDNNNENV